MKPGVVGIVECRAEVRDGRIVPNRDLVTLIDLTTENDVPDGDYRWQVELRTDTAEGEEG